MTVVLAILQARSSSTRFPRKVLQPLHGDVMIVRQVERISRCRGIDHLVVATSTDRSDDELAEVLRARGIEVRRGPLDDVVSRFSLVVDEFQPDHIVRLTADCPLTDPDVIDLVIDEHLRNGCDYTSNVLPPTFPDGLDVEVFTAEAFARLVRAGLSTDEREHVTLGMYAHPENYSIWNVVQETDRSEMRWTVDVPDDLVFAANVYKRLYEPGATFGQQDVCDLLEAEPALVRTCHDVARNAGLSKE